MDKNKLNNELIKKEKFSFGLSKNNKQDSESIDKDYNSNLLNKYKIADSIVTDYNRISNKDHIKELENKFDADLGNLFRKNISESSSKIEVPHYRSDENIILHNIARLKDLRP